MKVAFQTHAVAIYTHIFASMAALALGPFQFSNHLRQKYPAAHRVSGRIYLSVGVLVGGVSGFYVAQFAYGGLIGAAALLCLR